MPYVTCFERYALKRGMQKGLRKGRSEGRSEGEALGAAKGQAEGLRQAVQEVLRSRWGTVPPEVVQRLESTHNPELLSRSLRLAVLTPSLEAFLEALATSDR